MLPDALTGRSGTVVPVSSRREIIMAQVTRSPTLSERLHWNDFFRPWIVRLIFVGIGLLIGLYIVAPRQIQASESYLPSTYTDMPTGIVRFTGADGVSTFLPVRIADTSSARNNGFNSVGAISLGNSFLLIAQSRETTRVTRYDMQNVRRRSRSRSSMGRVP